MKKHVCNVYLFQLGFHFACHRWWFGTGKLADFSYIKVQLYFFRKDEKCLAKLSPPLLPSPRNRDGG